MSLREFIGMVIAIVIICIVIALEIPMERAKKRPQPETKMDNYSFAVGVCCASRVIADQHLSVTNNSRNYERQNSDEILHAARHFSQTNGWLPFNNHVGFRGDE